MTKPRPVPDPYILALLSLRECGEVGTNDPILAERVKAHLDKADIPYEIGRRKRWIQINILEP